LVCHSTEILSKILLKRCRKTACGMMPKIIFAPTALGQGFTYPGRTTVRNGLEK
jgi:hypothetical protein